MRHDVNTNRNETAPTRYDLWDNPRIPYVYPAKHANGYYARGRSENGKRQGPKFFGHKRYGGSRTAYELARQHAGVAVPQRHTGTLRLHEAETPQSPVSTHGNRHTLANRHIDLRRSRSNPATWFVIVQTGQGQTKRIRRFDVATYGLELALRNAVAHRLQWEQTHSGHPDRIGIDNWVRFYRYVIQKYETRPLDLSDLELPADIKSTSRYIQCTRYGGKQRRFYHAHYGGRYRAHVAAVIWAIEEVHIGEVVLAA